MRLFILLLLLSLYSISHGQTKVWDGGAGTVSFGDADNWNPDGIPASMDAVEIGYGDTVEVTSGTFEIQYIKVSSNALFTIQEGAQLNVLNSANTAFDASGSTSKIINRGTLEITNSGQAGLLIYGSFRNDRTGVLRIMDAGDYGIVTGTNDTLYNSGLIDIMNPADHGIYNTGTVTNYASGTIEISAGVQYGFRNGPSDYFNNYGALKVTGTTNYGVENSGWVTNFTGGTITISGGTEIGLNNRGRLTNQQGATIQITSTGDGFGDYGLNNDLDDTLRNFGVINIVNAADDGIYNNGYIKNYGTGMITVIAPGYDFIGYGINIRSGHTIANLGSITISGSSDHGLLNAGIFTNHQNATMNITDTSKSGIFNGTNNLIDNDGDITIQGSMEIGIINYGLMMNHSLGKVTVQN
jgi:hypothetical protein